MIRKILILFFTSIIAVSLIFASLKSKEAMENSNLARQATKEAKQSADESSRQRDMALQAAAQAQMERAEVERLIEELQKCKAR